MTANETIIRKAFQDQAGHCRALGSPFNAAICDLLAAQLSTATRLGARALAWSGNPDATHDALPLRLAAGLHALAFRARDPAWTALYPPAPMPDHAALRAGLDQALARHEDDLLPWLDLPPQTNEVGRAGVLMSGLLHLAARHRLPFALFELGSSGGLNLLLDRYRYTLGTTNVGPESPVRLAPKWTGPSPAPADVRVVARRGVDQAPIDVGTAFGRERLMAYVWPDQLERLDRTRAALKVAAAEPPALDKMDAADWVERTLPRAPSPGTHRVLMHSIVFQYFSAETKHRVRAQAEKVGVAACAESPFSWMRMEQTENNKVELRVRTWPGGQDNLLANVQAHGAAVDWVAE